MQPIEAYRRYAAMKDRSFCPLEELAGPFCVGRIDGHDVQSLGIDLWAVLMTICAKLTNILKHTDREAMLLPAAGSIYEAMIQSGETSQAEFQAEAFALIRSLTIRDGEPLKAHALN